MRKATFGFLAVALVSLSSQVGAANSDPCHPILMNLYDEIYLGPYNSAGVGKRLEYREKHGVVVPEEKDIPKEGGDRYRVVMYWCSMMKQVRCTKTRPPKMCEEWFKAAPRVCAKEQLRYDRKEIEEPLKGYLDLDICRLRPEHKKYRWW